MLVGVADPEAHAPGAPSMTSLDTDAVTLEGVEILQLICEIKPILPLAVLIEDLGFDWRLTAIGRK